MPSLAQEDADRGSPCPEDGDFFDGRPDAAETVEAISKFLNGLECQQQACFQELHTLLGKLSVLVIQPGSKISHAAALEGGFILTMDEAQQKTLEKVHTIRALIVQARSGIQVHDWYILGYTIYILVHTSLFSINTVKYTAHH